MRIRSVFKHSTQVVVEGALVSLLVVGLMAGTAFAGKGGGGHGGGGGGKTGGSGSLAVVMVSDANGNGLANWGDALTFTVTTAATNPFVKMSCSQNGVVVYTFSAGFFADYYWSKIFTLNSPSWSSGAASCTATLYTTTDGTSITTLATMSVAVGA